MLPEIEYGRALAPIVEKALQESGVQASLIGVDNKFGSAVINLSVKGELAEDEMNKIIGKGNYTLDSGTNKESAIHITTSDKLYRNLTNHILLNTDPSEKSDKALINRLAAAWNDKVSLFWRVMFGQAKDGSQDGLSEKAVNTFLPDSKVAHSIASKVDSAVRAASITSFATLPSFLALLQILTNSNTPSVTHALLKSYPAAAIPLSSILINAVSGKSHENHQGQMLDSLSALQDQLKGNSAKKG